MWLIETWDVLKWHKFKFFWIFLYGLIETWDVLKSSFAKLLLYAKSD